MTLQYFGTPADPTVTEVKVFEQLCTNFEAMIQAKIAPGNAIFPSRETEAERFVREQKGREHVRAATKKRAAALQSKRKPEG